MTVYYFIFFGILISGLLYLKYSKKEKADRYRLIWMIMTCIYATLCYQKTRPLEHNSDFLGFAIYFTVASIGFIVTLPIALVDRLGYKNDFRIWLYALFNASAPFWIVRENYPSIGAIIYVIVSFSFLLFLEKDEEKIKKINSEGEKQ